MDFDLLRLSAAKNILLEHFDGILEPDQVEKVEIELDDTVTPKSNIDSTMAEAIGQIEDVEEEIDGLPEKHLFGMEFRDSMFEEDVNIANTFLKVIQAKHAAYSKEDKALRDQRSEVRLVQEMMEDAENDWLMTERTPGRLHKDNYAIDTYTGGFTHVLPRDAEFGFLPHGIFTSNNFGERNFQSYESHFPKGLGDDWEFPRNYPDWCRTVSEFCIRNYFDDVVLGETITSEEQRVLAELMMELWKQASFPETIDKNASATSMFRKIKSMAQSTFTRAAKDAEWNAVSTDDIAKYNDTLTRLRYMEMCTEKISSTDAVDLLIVDKIMSTLDATTRDAVNAAMGPRDAANPLDSVTVQANVVRFVAESSHDSHTNDDFMAFCTLCQDKALAEEEPSDEEMN